MGRDILHVIETREQQGTEGPLAHDRTVTFQLCGSGAIYGELLPAVISGRAA